MQVRRPGATWPRPCAGGRPPGPSAPLGATSPRWWRPRSRADTSKVDVGTRLWRDASYTVLLDFAAALAQNFGASSVPLNFAGDAEHGRQTINAWIYAQTGNKIADLLPEAAIAPTTSSVLTAALHLKAPWRATFRELPASPNNFRSGDATPYAATMVHTQATLGYAVEGNTTAVEVALGRGELAALFVVPDGALESYLTSLDANALVALRGKLVAQEVDLTLPETAVAQTLALTDVLAHFGMTVATGDAADLQFSPAARRSASLRPSLRPPSRFTSTASRRLQPRQSSFCRRQLHLLPILWRHWLLMSRFYSSSMTPRRKRCCSLSKSIIRHAKTRAASYVDSWRRAQVLIVELDRVAFCLSSPFHISDDRTFAASARLMSKPYRFCSVA